MAGIRVRYFSKADSDDDYAAPKGKSSIYFVLCLEKIKIKEFDYENITGLHK